MKVLALSLLFGGGAFAMAYAAMEGVLITGIGGFVAVLASISIARGEK